MPSWGSGGNQTAGSGLGGGNVGGKGGKPGGGSGGGNGGKVGPNGLPSTGSPSGFSGPVAPGGSVAASKTPGGMTGGAPAPGGTGGSIWDGIKDFFGGMLNPTGDPLASTALKVAMGPISPALALVGGLQGMGVPSSPANTAGGYPDPNKDTGPTGPMWLDESGANMGAPSGPVSAPNDPTAPTIPGNVWTAGGVTGTHLPDVGPSQVPPVTVVPDQPQGEPINPLTNVVTSTTPASPLAKIITSALSGKSSQKMVA